MKKIILLLLIVATFITLSGCLKEKAGAESDGSVSISVFDLEGVEVINEDIDYMATKDDGTNTTMFDILMDNFEIVYKEYDFGVSVTGINDVIADSSQNQYLHIKHNGEASAVGVSDMVFADGDEIEFWLVTW